MINKNDWVVTNSGQKLFLTNPDPESILIEDIAHGLSQTCRWGGQCKTFYSVAQHCYMISSIVPRSDALWGLLHDAAEAYMTDLPRPLKMILPGYQLIESGILKAIAEKYGLPESIPSTVKKADNVMLATEARLLMNHCPEDMYLSEDALDIEIVPIDHESSKRFFLERFMELWDKR